MVVTKSLLVCLVALLAIVLPATSRGRGGHDHDVESNYYDRTCPRVLPIIREKVKKAIAREARMGASLLRLQFHDCFVNGCDASVLLDDTANFTGEKTATPNRNSLRGFEVIDDIKAELNRVCGNVVSCADILTVAARDSVSILGGEMFDFPVSLGRKDARTASFERAQRDIPSPFSNFNDLVRSFQKQRLDVKDLVALSGGHTIGRARCPTFRERAYNATNIDPNFAAGLRQICPPSGGITNLADLDSTTNTFDNAYYRDLQQSRGLLHSDQELFNGGGSAKLVERYARDPKFFARDFGTSMIRMGNIKVLTGDKGEVRFNCRRIN